MCMAIDEGVLNILLQNGHLKTLSLCAGDALCYWEISEAKSLWHDFSLTWANAC